MNVTDQRVINFLRHSGRASVTQIAENLGITRATVRSRMEKLEENGEILGYSVVLKSDTETRPVRGLMMIEIEGMGTERIVKQLYNFPEVIAIHTTNGRWDLIVELATETLEQFDKLLSRLRQVNDIKSSETSLLLSTRKETRLVR